MKRCAPNSSGATPPPALAPPAAPPAVPAPADAAAEAATEPVMESMIEVLMADVTSAASGSSSAVYVEYGPATVRAEANSSNGGIGAGGGVGGGDGGGGDGGGGEGARTYRAVCITARVVPTTAMQETSTQGIGSIRMGARTSACACAHAVCMCECMHAQKSSYRRDVPVVIFSNHSLVIAAGGVESTFSTAVCAAVALPKIRLMNNCTLPHTPVTRTSIASLNCRRVIAFISPMRSSRSIVSHDSAMVASKATSPR